MTPDEIKAKFEGRVLSAEEVKGDLHLTATAEGFDELCAFLRDDPECLFDYPGDLTGRDTGNEILLWYRLYSMKRNQTALIIVSLPLESPEIQSVTAIWPGLNWFERECYDMYGVHFAGHPDQGSPETMRILLPEDWEGHPFRKDYKPVFSGNPLHGPQETN